jgi:hypothetical protein
MKNLVAVLSGFLLTLGVFGGGALTTIFFVNASPTPVHSLDGDNGALWTNKAVVVNTDAGDLERLPARPQPQTVAKKTEPQAQQREVAQAPSSPPDQGGNAKPVLDSTTTAGISPAAAQQPVAAMNSAHVEWCSQRYRSYDPADNSYNSYSGVRRECISPYSETASNANAPAASDEMERADASAGNSPTLISAAAADEMSPVADSGHVQSCFDRYRSYRPEDNSYQPYGGGPRQQCE